MTRLSPAYNLYAIHKSEITDALISDEAFGLTWNPNERNDWYVCLTDDRPGITLLGGPYDCESKALSRAHMMLDTSGT